MPQQSPAPDVSFQLSEYSYSHQNTQYKTVHIVVVKHTSKNNEYSIGFLIYPLVIVFVIAITILFIISKIKQGPTTNRILNLLESLSNGMDNKMKSGRL